MKKFVSLAIKTADDIIQKQFGDSELPAEAKIRLISSLISAYAITDISYNIPSG